MLTHVVICTKFAFAIKDNQNALIAYINNQAVAYMCDLICTAHKIPALSENLFHLALIHFS